jgi:hypothetical protein
MGDHGSRVLVCPCVLSNKFLDSQSRITDGLVGAQFAATLLYMAMTSESANFSWSRISSASGCAMLHGVYHSMVVPT